MDSFSAKILKIGINPYVLVPTAVLKNIFKQAGKDKGAIPLKGKLNGKAFLQNLVKYSGKWRLYLNGPMREAAGIDVGDMAAVAIAYDPKPPVLSMHPKLRSALDENKKASAAFEKLSPSYRKEITRYINNLKTDESVERNVIKAIGHLQGKERFVGRDGVKTLETKK